MSSRPFLAANPSDIQVGFTRSGEISVQPRSQKIWETPPKVNHLLRWECFKDTRWYLHLDKLAGEVPPPTISDSFNSLLQTVQNVRGTGSSQQQTTSESSADADVAKQEGATVHARTAVSAGEPASIPTAPHYLLLIISCLVGLLGLRRLRA